MKAYNTPKDELHIESDTGETLVSITPEKTTIANLEGGGGGGAGVVVPFHNIEDAQAGWFVKIGNIANDGYSDYIVDDEDWRAFLAFKDEVLANLKKGIHTNLVFEYITEGKDVSSFVSTYITGVELDTKHDVVYTSDVAIGFADTQFRVYGDTTNAKAVIGIGSDGGALYISASYSPK